MSRSGREGRLDRVVLQDRLPSRLGGEVQRRSRPASKNHRRRLSMRRRRRVRDVHGWQRKVGQVTNALVRALNEKLA